MARGKDVFFAILQVSMPAFMKLWGEVSDHGHAVMFEAVGKALAPYVGLRVLPRTSMSENMLLGIAEIAIERG